MASSFGSQIRFSIFGESHGAAIGCLIEGLPAGFTIDREALQRFLARRAPGSTTLGTTRKEADAPEILSGILGDTLTGEALCAIIRNTSQHSSDYSQLHDLPRPGHADYTAFVRSNGANDIRGGGAFSGRLTAPLCIAGGIALQILAAQGITVGAHVAEIGGIADQPLDPVNVTAEELAELDKLALPVLDESAGEKMAAAVHAARKDGDSIGGIVEAAVVGLPPGLGAPIYDGMENCLARTLFGIPAVKGVEFGDGFQVARSRGSINNDPFYYDEKGNVRTRTNHCGGILGGITNGMPLIVRAAFKPTPSIALEQDTVSLSRRENAKVTVHGRHDPCIVPRAVPAVIAAVAITLLDFLPPYRPNC